MSDCIFCQIVAGKLASHKVWESETHLAFLSIFPNTEGVTVVIPKEHAQSYVFGVDAAVMHALMDAVSLVARKIDTAYPDVERTGLVFEGLGVDHLHAKLYPLHGTASGVGEGVEGSGGVGAVVGSARDEQARPETFFDQYPGYISSHDAGRADDVLLAAVAEKIRGV